MNKTPKSALTIQYFLVDGLDEFALAGDIAAEYLCMIFG